jgi:hypothetical protein
MKKTQISLALMACGLISASAADLPGSTSTTKQAGAAAQNAVLNVSGQTIMDSAGQQVGKLQQVILNSSGCIDMAAISLEQGKVVAVPWQLVSFQSGSGHASATSQNINFTVQADRAKLQQAPVFNVSQTVNQQQNIQQVYQYFGVQQGAAQGGTSSSSSSSSSSSVDSTSTPGQGASSSSGIGISGSSTNATDIEGKDLPPGLEKKDNLPPGLDKRETLPPGLEKRNNDAGTGGQGGLGTSSGNVEGKGNKSNKGYDKRSD